MANKKKVKIYSDLAKEGLNETDFTTKVKWKEAGLSFEDQQKGKSMKYHIEVAEVYGSDTTFKPELTITNGKSFSKSRAHQKRRVMQRHTNSLIYKVVRNK